MRKFKYFILAALALGIVNTNVACSKKSSSSDNNGGAVYNPNVVGPGGVINGNCTTCNFSQAQLFTVNTQGYNGSQATWQILGDQNVINQIQSAGWNVLATYQGAAAANATMVLNQAIYVGQCQFPAGNYTVTTSQQGTATQGPIFQIPLNIAYQGGGQVQAIMQGTPVGVMSGQVTSFRVQIQVSQCNGVMTFN